MLKNKLIMITGASAGFGEATAKLFAKEGAHLILIARRRERLEALANNLTTEFRDQGVKVLALPLDISNYDEVRSAIQKLPHEFSKPDILINNAGMVRGMDKQWEVTPEDWNEMIDTNVKGLLNLNREIIPMMLKRNSGHIINVSSISGYQVYPGGGVYCSTKFAVRAITDTLRMELVSTPLRVSMISPGLAESEFSLVRFHGDESKAKQVYKGIHALEPKDIAEALHFIATRSEHIQVGDLILYPTNQASVSTVHREEIK